MASQRSNFPVTMRLCLCRCPTVLSGQAKCWKLEVNRPLDLLLSLLIGEFTGNRAVVQVFEGTSGIDVKKVHI